MSSRLMHACGAAVFAAAWIGGCDTYQSGSRADTSWYDEDDDYLRRTRQPAATRPADEDRPLATTQSRPEVRVENRREERRTSGAMNVASLAYPTGDEATSALLIEERLPREVRPDQPFEYEIHVTNLTRNPLRNVVIRSEHAENLTILGSTPEGQAGTENREPSRPATPELRGAPRAGAGGATQWTFAEIPPSATEVIRVNARAGEVGTATNCLSASYSNVLCAGTQVVQPAITLVKSVPQQVLACEPLTMKYEVRNTGSGTAENVVIQETLPQGLTTAEGRNTVELNAGTLGPGQSKVVTVNLKAARPGKYESAATARAAGGLESEAQSAAVVVRQPVLALDVDCGESVLMGKNATFRVTVKNTGDAPAENTTVTLGAPRGTQFVSADSGGRAGGGTGGGTWSLGTLEPGANRTLSMQARVLQAGDLQIAARAMARCAPEVTDSCTASVQGSADIGAALSDREGVVPVGANHIYNFEIQNQGQIDLTNVRVAIKLPEGMAFQSVTGAEPPKARNGGLDFVMIGGLRPGEKKTFQINVKADRPGEYLVISETTADQIKQPMREDEITTFVERESATRP